MRHQCGQYLVQNYTRYTRSFTWRTCDHALANFCYQCMDRQLQHRSRSRDLRRRPKAAIHGRRRPKPAIGQRPRRDRRQRRARRHSPHLGMRVKSTRLSNSSCGLSTSWKSDQNQSKVSEAGALEGVRFPLRTCVITIRLRDLRRCLCFLHDLSLLFSRSGRSIVDSTAQQFSGNRGVAGSVMRHQLMSRNSQRSPGNAYSVCCREDRWCCSVLC